MFYFSALLGAVIETVSENAIRVIDKEYPKEIVYNNTPYVYGTMHNNAAVYYRKTWFC